MATLLRFLKFVHRCNFSFKTSITNINFESFMNLNEILPSQTVFSTKQINKYSSTANAQQEINHETNINQKMTVLTAEIEKFGRIEDFNIDSILQDIEKNKTVSSSQGLFLLICCSEFVTDRLPASRLKLGIKLWKTLKRLGVPLDISHYNALLSVYIENEHEFCPLNFLEEMFDNSILPNRVTFQKLILQFCNQGKVKEATKLLESAKKQQILINEKMLSPFIWGHFMNNDMNAALNVIKEMESLKIPMTIETYSTLMYVFSRKGNIEGIREILKECETKEIFVSNKVLLTIVYHLSLAHFPEYLHEILSMTGGNTYEKTANTFIYKLLDKKQDRAAFEIFQNLKKHKNFTVKFFPVINTANACVLHLLERNEIRGAVDFMRAYNPHNTRYLLNSCKHSLIQAFKNTKDVSSFVWILHYLYKNNIGGYHNNNLVQYFERKYFSNKFSESCILGSINSDSNSNKFLCIKLFRNLVDKGLTISPELAEKIEKKLGDTMTTEISEALSDLKSGNLVLKSLNCESSKIEQQFIKIEKWESLANFLKITNKSSTIYLKKRLLDYHCRSLNEKKTAELVLELEQEPGVKLSASTHSLLIEMYLKLDKVNKAQSWLIKTKTENPHFCLNVRSNLKLVTALVQTGRLDDAQEYLTWPTYNLPFYEHYKLIRILLESVAKYDDEQLLQKFFDVLHRNGYFERPNVRLFEKLIQLYLTRDNRKAALKVFISVFESDKLMPSTAELLKHFIDKKDYTSLQIIKNICPQVMGENVFYFHLAMAHLLNGELYLATKIIQHHYSTLHEENILHYAEKFYINDETDNLEKLFIVSNNLKYDVEKLNIFLLESYSIKKEWEKSYDLWTTMQNCGLEPSPTFIKNLFSVLNKTFDKSNKTMKDFEDALEHDLCEAEVLLNSLPKELESLCYSALCKRYTIKNNFPKVVQYWQKLYKDLNLNIDQDTGTFILSKMAEKERIESIETIGMCLSPQEKEKLRYTYYLNQAVSYKAYFEELKTKLLDESKTFDDIMKDYQDAVTSSQKYPELYETVRIFDEFLKEEPLCNKA